MTCGSKTDTEKVNRLMAAYLLGGNIAKAARETGIPVTTAYKIVAREQRDRGDEWEEAGEQLRARAADSVLAVLLRGVEVAAERLEDPEWCASFKGSDPTPQYLRGISDALKQIRSAGESVDAPDSTPAVVVNLNVEPGKS